MFSNNHQPHGFGSYLIIYSVLTFMMQYIDASAITFSGVGVPTGSDMHKVIMSQMVMLNGRTVVLGSLNQSAYHVLVQPGSAFKAATNYQGDLFGKLNTVLSTSEGVFDFDYTTWSKKTTPIISQRLEFSSLISHNGKIYMISQIEEVPGASYFSELSQDPNTGILTLTKTLSMDWLEYGGLWNPCAGSLSPWNTHIGSEEYEPDAATIFSASEFDTTYEDWDDSPASVLQTAMRLYGIYPNEYGDDENSSFPTYMSLANEIFEPYNYGYTYEAGIDSTSADKNFELSPGYFVKKHPCMGRRSGELAVVMPDSKSVYLTDDGTNVFLSMFIADIAEDLSSGELYCARLQQQSSANGGTFGVSWISMGSANDVEILSTVVEGINFTSIFDSVAPLKNDSMPWIQCPNGYTAIQAMSKTGNKEPECLKLKPGMELIASRLETRRYAGYLGCTTEFRKMEGLVFMEGKVYFSISEVSKGMEDRMKSGKPKRKYDLGTGNHIRLPYNPCGCIYELGGFASNSFMATTMQALVCGTPANTSGCLTSGIANPDNVAAIQGHSALLIAEDGENHANAMLWKFDLVTLKLERIATVEEGSEVTSPYFYPDILGFSYMMMISQHPTNMKSTIGYLVWPKDCKTNYPNFSTPGDMSIDTCARITSSPTASPTATEIASASQYRPSLIIAILFLGML